ncbi:uncharacterized protein LOC142228631, partial [Haematobia irritans]|uniref:uncharacterized protein LOC142228631 n=1 Tax=Haematobia irritans TaxID=7368 RepID=UPI003F4FA3BA
CACCGGGVDVVRRSKCTTTSTASAVALANNSCAAPIPLPPKKHQRSSSSGREPRESAVPALPYNANKCEEHEYDEYCPGAYEPQSSHHQPSTRQSHVSGTTSTKYQQRSATFDVADAREYELKRLGNRRSQSQQATNLKLNRNGGITGGDHHRGERTHDRERSRSDHRIASYACDDTAMMGHMGNGGMGHTNHHQQQYQQQRQQQRREKTFKV